MPVLRFPFEESWSFDARTSVDLVTSLTKIFSDSRLSVIQDGAEIEVSYEDAIPKKPILFLGLTVDLEDGWVYAGNISGITLPKLGTVNDLFRYFTGRPCDRDTALSTLEKFKMTGNLEKMFTYLDQYYDGSMIAASINAKFSQSVSIKTDKVRELLRTIEVFYTYFGRVVRQMEKYLQPEQYKRVFWSFHRVSGFPHGKTVDESALLSSTPAYWESRDTANILSENGYSKQAILASNTIEICDAMDEVEETVLSTDIKGRLKNLGFDKVLNGREISSITANPQYVKQLSKQVKTNADLGDTSREVRTYFTKETSAVMVRNTIKAIGKLVVRLNKIREGN